MAALLCVCEVGDDVWDATDRRLVCLLSTRPDLSLPPSLPPFASSFIPHEPPPIQFIVLAMSSAAKKGTKRPRPRPAARRPSLSDESDDGAIDDLDLTDNNNNRQRDDEEKDAKELETPAQKRLRLARSYLAQVSDDLKKKAAAKPVEVAEGVYEFSAEDVDRELIAERLVQDQLEASGRAFHRVADALVRRKDPVKAELDIAEGNLRIFGGRTGHRLAVTGLAIATPKAVATAGAAGAAGGGGARQPVYLYSVSKDASIIKWDFYSGKEVQVIKGELKRTKKRKRIDKGRKKEKDPNQGPIQGHTDEIWAIAVSSDGRFLVGRRQGQQPEKQTRALQSNENEGWSVSLLRTLGIFLFEPAVPPPRSRVSSSDDLEDVDKRLLQKHIPRRQF